MVTKLTLTSTITHENKYIESIILGTKVNWSQLLTVTSFHTNDTLVCCATETTTEKISRILFLVSNFRTTSQ